jgi:hypothetical protein
MNKETHSEIMVFAVLIGLAVFLIKIALLLAICTLAGLCGFLTVAALGAWNKPDRLGPLVIQPEDARAFIARGLIGAASTLGLLYLAKLFGFEMVGRDMYPVAAIFGYALGSIGGYWEDMKTRQQAEESATPTIEFLPPAPPPVQKPEFRFASWDDEDAR